MSRGASTQRSRFYAAAICMLLWFWPAFGVWADRQSVRQGYASPEEAAAALVSAARSHDQATLSEIFGTGSEKLLSSGDRCGRGAATSRSRSLRQEAYTCA